MRRATESRHDLMKALVIVDVQNDFLPGGPMAVPDGDSIIPILNRLQGQFRIVVATQDWHPANHSSFAANHAGKRPGEIALLRRGPVVLRPVHCVQHSHGAELAPSLNRERINRIIRQGTDTNLDSFSGFFDNDHMTPTGLGEYLRDKRADDVYLCGLTLETTIKNTALDALNLGFQCFLVEDACRAMKPAGAVKAVEEMKAAGVLFTSSREILQWPVRR
jgi:nicotinamidase/pyrazinamidase